MRQDVKLARRHMFGVLLGSVPLVFTSSAEARQAVAEPKVDAYEVRQLMCMCNCMCMFATCRVCGWCVEGESDRHGMELNSPPDVQSGCVWVVGGGMECVGYDVSCSDLIRLVSLSVFGFRLLSMGLSIHLATVYGCLPALLSVCV